MSVVIENWVEPPCLSLMRESTGFVQILLLCLNHINLWGLCTCVVKKNHCFMWLECLSITYPMKIITSVYIIDAKFKFKSIGKMYPWIKWTFLTTANNDFTVVLNQMVHNYPSFHITCTLILFKIIGWYRHVLFIYGNEYDSPITRDSIVSHFFFCSNFYWSGCSS